MLPARKTTILATDGSLQILPLVTGNRECKGSAVIAVGGR
jgi:hypothetical protein